MKHILTLLLTLSAAVVMTAAPNFTADKRYHIVCQQFTSGCVVDGASAGQQTPLYYYANATTANETYWIFTEVRNGCFSIKNAKTGQYITYDGVRDTYRRYVSMTNAMDGDKSLWNFSMMSEGVYCIRNVGETNQVWDTRVDSYMVGTYARGQNDDISNIERYMFYDESGNQIFEKNDTPEVKPTGYDVSSWLNATTDALDGWMNYGGWFMNTGAGGSHYNGNASTVAPFIENWHATNYGGLGDCSLQQSLIPMPAGSYTLQADMIAVWQGTWSNPEAPATNVELFANDNSVSVGTANNVPERYQVNFTLNETGSVTLGVSATGTNANWLAIDNVTLLYNGSEQELLDAEREKVRIELSDYYVDSEIETLIQQAGDDFNALEKLRKSVAFLPVVDPLSLAASNITIDGHGLVYVESLDLYMCSVPLQVFGSDYEATINYNRRDGAGMLYIDNKMVTDGTQYKFASVRGGREYTLKINMPNGTQISKQLTFTSLPVVRMYGSFNDNYSEGTIAVFEPDLAIPENFHMKAKWRGGITNGSDKHKRNYHVKLQDADGNKLETKFFGLRNDNSWILESCQVDMSRIRNRVLTDLWNDFSTPPYYIDQEPKAKTGTRGKFVELVLNDEYRGIYCMTENIDRKQMKLKKYDEETSTTHGQLWKAKDWSFAVFMGPNQGHYRPADYLSTPNNQNEMWDSYQVKYPDFEDYGNQTDWSTLYNAVNFVCYTDDNNFREHVAEYFDIPVVMDYYLLMECVLATDNHGKNQFYAVYDKEQDKRITFSVWDMDATCGQRWSDSYYHWNGMQPEQDYSTYIWNNEHGENNLYKRLRELDPDDFNLKMRMRYRDLRDSYLDTESILDRFRTYLSEFQTCGADKREYAKWNGDTDIARLSLDFDDELHFLIDWFSRRMEYLDQQRFDIASLPTAITELPSYSISKAVYDLKGQQVGTTDHIKQLPAGIYIIGGRKVVLK